MTARGLYLRALIAGLASELAPERRLLAALLMISSVSVAATTMRASTSPAIVSIAMAARGLACVPLVARRRRSAP